MHLRDSVVDSDSFQVPGRSTAGIVVTDVDTRHRAEIIIGKPPVEGADPTTVKAMVFVASNVKNVALT